MFGFVRGYIQGRKEGRKLRNAHVPATCFLLIQLVVINAVCEKT